MKVVALTLIILGLLLGIRYVLYFQTLHVYLPGDTYEEQVVLLSEPKTSGFGQSFRIGSILVQPNSNQEFHYGDSLHISGVVTADSFESNDKTITRLVVKDPKIQLLPANPLIQSAAYLRNRIEGTFKAYLPQKEAGLLFGIVFGGTQGFSHDMQDTFRNAGVLHVVAASGMNVTMVAAFLLLVFSRLLKRQQALFLTILGVFYYALLSGFSPSIVRASIMATVAFTAGILGRQSYGFITLALTVFIMLMLHPETLFDAGFLLSLTSTIGILYCKPFFDSLKIVQKTKGISDDIATTASAQIGSLPVMVGVFGTYSYISILVNALVLWTIPFLMILGGIAALCAIAVPFVSVPLLYLSYPLLLYFEAVIQYFGEFSQLQVAAISPLFIVSYYLIFTAVVLFLSKRKKHP